MLENTPENWRYMEAALDDTDNGFTNASAHESRVITAESSEGSRDVSWRWRKGTSDGGAEDPADPPRNINSILIGMGNEMSGRDGRVLHSRAGLSGAAITYSSTYRGVVRLCLLKLGEPKLHSQDKSILSTYHRPAFVTAVP